jgi:hypothetical protein
MGLAQYAGIHPDEDAAVAVLLARTAAEAPSAPAAD